MEYMVMDVTVSMVTEIICKEPVRKTWVKQ